MYQARVNIWAGQYEAARLTIDIPPALVSDANQSDESYGQIYPDLVGWLALVDSDAATASRYLQKAVDGQSRRHGHSERQEWGALFRATLSRAEWALGRHAVARQQMFEALTVAVEIRAFITLLHVLPILPVLLAGEEAVQHKVRAVEVYALANSHPFIANCQFFYDIAGKEIEQVEAVLPSDVVAVAKARGQGLEFWETAENLLQEITELGWGK